MRLSKAIGLAIVLSLSAWTFISGATAQPAPAKGGAWQLDEEDADHPALVFKRGEDVLFQIGAGQPVEMWIAWPGLPQPDGDASVTIRTSTRAFTMKGELTNSHPFARGDEQATYFTQSDMGLARSRPEFANLAREYNAFLDALLASKDVVIATKAGTITLPRIDVKDAKKLRL